MWDRDGATEAQLKWLEGFNNAIDSCKEHILEVKDEVEKYDLDEAELKRFNPLYWKKGKGKSRRRDEAQLFTPNFLFLERKIHRRFLHHSKITMEKIWMH